MMRQRLTVKQDEVVFNFTEGKKLKLRMVQTEGEKKKKN